MKYFLTALGIAVLSFLAFSIGRWQKQQFTRIPEKRMWIDGRDTKAGVIVRWPQKGVATIFSSKFGIAFEGVSWSETSLIKAQYQVDGRYGGLFSPDSVTSQDDMGNGVKFEYSALQRTATITFKKHCFVYCDYLGVLNADGTEYSTAQEPVHLWVSKRGPIKRPNEQWR